MRGVQVVKVRTKRVRYQLSLRRNITIICGDSGTGKTTLYEMIADRTRLGEESGVKLTCTKDCVALIDLDWQNQLAGIRDSIVFVDEGAHYVVSEEFAKAVRESDNYYVLITRQALHQLPYSVDEVYSIKTSGNNHTLVPCYKSSERHLYGRVGVVGAADFEALLTEDSKAGYEFYKSRFADSAITCVSAGTKSAIYQWLLDHPDARTFVVADGAAFGAEADRVLKLQEASNGRVVVCLPESFEWLILKAGLIKDARVVEVLADTSDYVESAKYESWEQFFTDYLRDVTRRTPMQYVKTQLNDYYKVEKNADRIIALIECRNIK